MLWAAPLGHPGPWEQGPRQAEWDALGSPQWEGSMGSPPVVTPAGSWGATVGEAIHIHVGQDHGSPRRPQEGRSPFLVSVGTSKEFCTLDTVHVVLQRVQQEPKGPWPRIQHK